LFVETEAVARAWKEVAGEHVIHIPAALPWVKHQPMHQAEARKRLNLPESAFICLFFGTHREGKDYRLAIEAAKRSNSKPYLWFVGPLISGNDPDALLSELGYPDASSRKGYLPDEDVPAVFDACDAVMLPYADNYVKGSAVLLQACHFKKPVIATHTGHLRDYVLENENGLLFDTGSIESLAACYDELGTLKANHRLNQRFDYTRSHSNYSWNTLIGSYLKVFFK
jgi:glycosyltransferase involved in cell wall biosynthesis